MSGTATGHPSWEGGYVRPNNNPEIDDAPGGEYLTDYLSRKATTFIRECRDEPFYLQLSPYSVHLSLQVSQSRVEHFEQKAPVCWHDDPTYAAMIKSVDRGVGRIMKTLASSSIRTTGEWRLQVHGLKKNGVTDNAPLKGGKGSFDEGNRVELYNLEEDLGETRNLVRQNPEKRERLLDQFNGWLETRDAPLPTPKEN